MYKNMISFEICFMVYRICIVINLLVIVINLLVLEGILPKICCACTMLGI